MMAEFMTFQLEADTKYGSEELYLEFMALFDSFPLAATIAGSPLGTFLAVHGGIGPEITSIEDIESIDRFMEPPSSGPLCDILWSDPLELPERPTKRELESWSSIEFAPNTLRQTSYHYGLAAVRSFLEGNNLACIVRGHQVVDAGFKEHRYLTTRKLPFVITVFSAPNYCDMYGNKGAAVWVNQTGVQFLQTDAVAHPYFLPDFAEVFSWSIPYLMESLVTMLSDLVIAIKEENMSDVSVAKRERDTLLAEKMSQMRQRLCDLETRQARIDKMKAEILSTQHPNVDKFLKAVAMDSPNEQCPKPKAASHHGPRAAGLTRRTSNLFW
jgi:serine/threonine-protein phosphatase 2B catalytic subunit